MLALVSVESILMNHLSTDTHVHITHIHIQAYCTYVGLIHTHTQYTQHQRLPHPSQGELSVNSRGGSASPPPPDREGSPLLYGSRLSTEPPSSPVPPSSTGQQEQKKNGEGEEDPNTIPCESCGKNIPIPDFIEHEVTST